MDDNRAAFVIAGAVISRSDVYEGRSSGSYSLASADSKTERRECKHQNEKVYETMFIGHAYSL
jgi:hypothetical protein